MLTPEKLNAILGDVFGIDPPPPDVDLVEDGLLDSLMLVTLLAELESTFSIRIPLENLDLEELRTVAGLSGLVERQLSSNGADVAASGDELVVPLRTGHGPPVILVPGAGGSPSQLLPLAQALETTRPVYGLDLASSEDLERPPRVEDIADAYAQAIGSVPEQGPCVLCGVSFGGLIAFEMARRLDPLGRPVERVVLMDARLAPRSLSKRAYWSFRLTQPFRILRFVLTDFRTRAPDVTRRAFRRLSRHRLLTSKTSHKPQWATVANVAGAAYRPGAYDGTVTLFVTSAPPMTSFRPERVWSRRVRGDFSVEQVPGEHADFLKVPQLGVVAERFSSLLTASGESG